MYVALRHRSSSYRLRPHTLTHTHIDFCIAYASCPSHSVIIFGIYLLSKHGEEDVGSGSMGSEALASSRAHLTSGHFGALMPLSPSHRSTSMLASQQSKTYEDKEEQTPLRHEARLHQSNEGSVTHGNGHPSGNGNGYHQNGFIGPKANGAILKGGESPRAYQRIVI